MDLKEPTTLIEEYEVKTIKILTWSLQVITYKLDTKYVCIVNNTDPGATICRMTDTTRQGVQRKALEHANSHLSSTVVLDVYVPEKGPQLDRIMLMVDVPPVTFSINEFLAMPITDRMNHILGGNLVFYGTGDELIPAGSAMKLLSEASAA